MKSAEEIEHDKTCAHYIVGQPYEPCPGCPRYDINCREYVPLEETQPERVSRIMRNLHKGDLKCRLT